MEFLESQVTVPEIKEIAVVRALEVVSTCFENKREVTIRIEKYDLDSHRLYLGKIITIDHIQYRIVELKFEALADGSQPC